MATKSSLADTLRALESTEANLAKLERLWAKLQRLIPQGVAFGDTPDYEDLRRRFQDILSFMPAIDGWRMPDNTASLNEIARDRLDALEENEISITIAVEEGIQRPGRDLAEYRYRLDRKRRELTRQALTGRIEEIDGLLDILSPEQLEESEPGDPIDPDLLSRLRSAVAEIETLLGSGVKRPPRWPDLIRHLRFGLICDLLDIMRMDWPDARAALDKALYGKDEAIPVPVADLGELAAGGKSERIPTKLKWEDLTAEDFERLIFALISAEPRYENPQWLLHTNAADTGRDVSATRVTVDPLSGTRRERIIFQCKHWRSKSVGLKELSVLKEQVALHEPPRVHALIIASTGRFSADAVRSIEKHNDSGSGLHIEMWPDSHLERLLSARPDLVAEFRLR